VFICVHLWLKRFVPQKEIGVNPVELNPPAAVFLLMLADATFRPDAQRGKNLAYQKAMGIHMRTFVFASLATSVIVTALTTVFAQDDRSRQRTAAANLRQICVALTVYAADHKGNYPPDLGAFARTDMKLYKIEPDAFLNPAAGKSVPANVKSDPAALSNWLNKEADVQYTLPPGTRMNHVKKTTVVLILKPADERAALTAAYADGSVKEYVERTPAGGAGETDAAEPSTKPAGP
jgi:hypothetical protein